MRLLHFVSTRAPVKFHCFNVEGRELGEHQGSESVFARGLNESIAYELSYLV